MEVAVGDQGVRQNQFTLATLSLGSRLHAGVWGSSLGKTLASQLHDVSYRPLPKSLGRLRGLAWLGGVDPGLAASPWLSCFSLTIEFAHNP